MYLSLEDVLATRDMPSRQAAKKLGVGKTTVNKYRALYAQYGDTELPKNARVLILDIESKPLTVYSWGLWNQNISIGQIIDSGGMICFAAKWLGSEEVLFYADDSSGGSTSEMIAQAHALLDSADVVVTYNGDRYDVKRLNNEFLREGYPPPAPYKSIDLYKVNKARFDLPSRKLDYIAGVTDVGNKLKHQGFDLWLDCMAGDPEAWAVMEEYNRQDVLLTERLYIKLLPWLTNVPHMGIFSSDGLACPYCGSVSLQDTGRTTQTFVQEYDLLKCSNCEGWSRTNKPIGNKLGSRATK